MIELIVWSLCNDCACVCAVIPFQLDVRLVDVPTGVKMQFVRDLLGAP